MAAPASALSRAAPLPPLRLLPLLLLVASLAGCSDGAGGGPNGAPGGDGPADVQVATAYDAAHTPAGDRSRGPAQGSAAAGGVLTAYLVREGHYGSWKDLRDSGLYDPPEPPMRQPGDTLSVPDGQQVQGYRLPLDGGGRVAFLVEGSGLWLSLSVTGGAAAGASCAATYRAAPPVDLQVVAEMEPSVPFGIECSG